MQVEFVVRGDFELNEKVRRFAEKKLSKLKKYFNQVVEARVELSQEKHTALADIFIKGKDFDVKSTARAKELTTAIHEAVEKLEIQARRAKTRLTGRKRHAVSGPEVAAWQLEVLERSSIGSGRPRIVQTSTIPIKPMTVEEAALALEESKNDFIVFRNAEDDRINVLYRRKDKNLGLITTEL